MRVTRLAAYVNSIDRHCFGVLPLIVKMSILIFLKTLFLDILIGMVCTARYNECDLN